MSFPKIVVHWLENSRAQRILWLLEELDLPYEVKKYARDPVTKLAPPELHAIHALGKSPVITIEEDGKTITLAESGAISEFLIERFGAGKLAIAPGGDAQTRADYLYWLHYAEGSIMLPLMLSIVFSQIPKATPFFIRPIASLIAGGALSTFIKPRLRENFNFVNDSLAGKQFFVGDELTGADIMMVFPVEGLELALGYEAFPHIKSWFERVSTRPAYLRALEKGGANHLATFTQ